VISTPACSMCMAVECRMECTEQSEIALEMAERRTSAAI
jgi:hypothetical protein